MEDNFKLDLTFKVHYAGDENVVTMSALNIKDLFLKLNELTDSYYKCELQNASLGIVTNELTNN